MINIIKDKDAIWETDKYDVILIGTSYYCMLTNGFQSKMRIKYPYIEKKNNETNYGDRRKLGTRITFYESPIISLLYICNYPHSKRVFIDYKALKQCLETANAEFKGKKVMTTLLGCSRFDGNGDKNTVLNIIKETCTDIDLDVYDYNQLPKRFETHMFYRKIFNSRKVLDHNSFQILQTHRRYVVRKLYLVE